MRLASSTARISVSWSGLFITATQLHRVEIKTGEDISFHRGAAVCVPDAIAIVARCVPQAALGLIKPRAVRPDVRPCKATSGRSLVTDRASIRQSHQIL
jgi:hypothetical protein